MVHRVDDVDVLIGVEGHPGRTVELALTGARLAETGQELTIAIERRDPVERLVRDVDVLFGVGDYGDRPLELALLVANLAEGPTVLIVERILPDQRRSLLAAQDEHPPRSFWAKCDADRKVGQPAHPQRLEIREPRSQQSVRSGHQNFSSCEYNAFSPGRS